MNVQIHAEPPTEASFAKFRSEVVAVEPDGHSRTLAVGVGDSPSESTLKAELVAQALRLLNVHNPGAVSAAMSRMS